MSAATPRSSRKGGKRSSSPAASGAGANSKRKKAPGPTTQVAEQKEVSEAAPVVAAPEEAAAPAPSAPPGGAPPSQPPAEPATTTEPAPAPTFVFKDPNFVHSSKGTNSNRKTKVWKNLKQILAAERSQQWAPGGATYGSIEAPPSFKPARKYSDLSGLSAAYTDPQTKIRYFSTDEFSRVRMLPSDIVAGYLSLRKANSQVP